ncbi:MAG: HEAT repeat domain-containing protein [Gemmatimonadales bacterium]|jgi:methylated-DNA-[protein]-cysteine S-methyltransferase
MKTRLRELLIEGDFEAIAEGAVQKRRLLGTLVSLTFDPDPQIGWRAVEALGLAARRVAQDDPGYVREQLRRLYWLISEESGGICWHAPGAMAEIVRHEPETFADYVPIVVFLIESMAEEDLEHFKADVLWAIGRLGPIANAYIEEIAAGVAAALDDPDPQVRGTAVWCLGRVGRATALATRSDLLSDEGPVALYQDGSLQCTSVGELARRALANTAVNRS